MWMDICDETKSLVNEENHLLDNLIYQKKNRNQLLKTTKA